MSISCLQRRNSYRLRAQNSRFFTCGNSRAAQPTKISKLCFSSFMYFLPISREIIFASIRFWVISGSFSRKLPCQNLSHPASLRIQHCNYSLTPQYYEIATCLLVTFPLFQWAQSQVLRMKHPALKGCRQALQVT